MQILARLLLVLLLTSAFACQRRVEVETRPVRPSILLVTLDTTRADAIGPNTPSFNALASRGRRFRYAYATVPETLPSHVSMMTGLYPAAHGIHENARQLPATQPLLAERLRDAGYRTAAFVSGYPLDRRFGLARGFETYDDDLGPGRVERSAKETTDHALAYLGGASADPVFIWVHYFDPHYPYEPTYRDEVAAMDRELGRLVAVFARRGATAIVVVGDHGEALGEHGEAQHGNLLYEAVMRVPLVIVGPDVPAGAIDAPVSTRRVFHTVLDWAGLGSGLSLRGHTPEIVVAEAMKPFLSFGWQPQVMAVETRLKAIHAGTLEVYDVFADPSETRNIANEAGLSRSTRKTLREYPIPSLTSPQPPSNLTDEERKQLASLGYVSSDARPVVRPDAPRPVDMVPLFDALDRASTLFIREEYVETIPMFEQILEADPNNLMTALRLAAAHSVLGHREKALTAFRRAEAIAPDSPDVRHYLALHFVRTEEWQRAAPLLERVLTESPDRLPALEAMATVRERQGRLDEALALWEKIHAMRGATAAELLHKGELAMQIRRTAVGIAAFEAARALQGASFRHDLELGVLYLDQRRLDEARAALDRVPPSHPGYPMALFKRAQVSVLLGEADRAARIDLARKHADATTRPLIANDRLFRE